MTDEADNFVMTGKELACPKCGLEFKTLLHPFCQHSACPPREHGKLMEAQRTKDQPHDA